MREVHRDPFPFGADSLSIEIQTGCIARIADGYNLALYLLNLDGKAVATIFPLTVSQFFQEPVHESDATWAALCVSTDYHAATGVRFSDLLKFPSMRLAGGFFA